MGANSLRVDTYGEVSQNIVELHPLNIYPFRLILFIQGILFYSLYIGSDLMGCGC